MKKASEERWKFLLNVSKKRKPDGLFNDYELLEEFEPYGWPEQPPKIPPDMAPTGFCHKCEGIVLEGVSKKFCEKCLDRVAQIIEANEE